MLVVNEQSRKLFLSETGNYNGLYEDYYGSQWDLILMCKFILYRSYQIAYPIFDENLSLPAYHLSLFSIYVNEG